MTINGKDINECTEEEILTWKKYFIKQLLTQYAKQKKLIVSYEFEGEEVIIKGE